MRARPPRGRCLAPACILVGLEFHESRWRNEAVNRHRPPANLAEDLIHFTDPRNALKGDPGIEQSLEINLVGILLQEKHILPHDETPDRVIDRGIIVVALIDRELEQVFWKRGDSRVVHRDSVFSFHCRLQSHVGHRAHLTIVATS